MNHPSDTKMVKAAREMYHEPGRIEVEYDAKVSRSKGNSDKGAYVSAWVWIPDSEARRVDK